MQPKTKYGKSCYHVRIQRKEYDPQTGKEKFAPFEQYFTLDEYKRFLERPNGYTVLEVLYDPTQPKKAESEDDSTEEAKTRRPRKS